MKPKLLCPLCEQSDAMRVQHGLWVCDRCDVPHDNTYVAGWNRGFQAGRRSVGSSDPKFPHAVESPELFAVVLTICHDPSIGRFNPFIANTTHPYRTPGARTAQNALGTLFNKVVVADKKTLLANGFDLCEGDFDEPLELPAVQTTEEKVSG